MKKALTIVIAAAVLLTAIIATQRYRIIYSTDHMTGLVACDNPTNGNRDPICRLLSEHSN